MMWVDHERNIMHFVGERQHVEDCCIAAGELLDPVAYLGRYPEMAGQMANDLRRWKTS